MKASPWLVLAALVSFGVGGCGKSPAENGKATAEQGGQPTGSAAGAAASGPSTPTPEIAVTEFLDAVRSGNDDKAGKMLTPLAREKVAEQHMVVAPPGSDTAKFEIGRVERIGEDGARVVTRWIDVGDNGQSRTDEVIWMVRQVAEGWRIAGVAAPVFEGEPPLLLNFEDPADMLRKQQMVRDEIRRRMEQEGKQTQTSTATVPGDAAAAGGKPASNDTGAQEATATTSGPNNSNATDAAAGASGDGAAATSRSANADNAVVR